MNKDFDVKDLADIFSNVVIPDLAVFSRYIEGLVTLKSKGGTSSSLYPTSLTDE